MLLSQLLFLLFFFFGISMHICVWKSRGVSIGEVYVRQEDRERDNKLRWLCHCDTLGIVESVYLVDVCQSIGKVSGAAIFLIIL